MPQYSDVHGTWNTVLIVHQVAVHNNENATKSLSQLLNSAILA